MLRSLIQPEDCSTSEDNVARTVDVVVPRLFTCSYTACLPLLLQLSARAARQIPALRRLRNYPRHGNHQTNLDKLQAARCASVPLLLSGQTHIHHHRRARKLPQRLLFLCRESARSKQVPFDKELADLLSPVGLKKI